MKRLLRIVILTLMVAGMFLPVSAASYATIPPGADYIVEWYYGEAFSMAEYKELLALIDNLPNNFVRYEQLSAHGVLEQFAFSNPERTYYCYHLLDDDNRKIVIAFDHTKKDISEIINRSLVEISEDMATMERIPNSSGYCQIVHGDAVYSYHDGKLECIEWMTYLGEASIHVSSEKPPANGLYTQLISTSEKDVQRALAAFEAELFVRNPTFLWSVGIIAVLCVGGMIMVLVLKKKRKTAVQPPENDENTN